MATPAWAAGPKTEQKPQTPTKVSPATATNVNQQQSPRNTGSSTSTSGTYVSGSPIEVSKALQDGEKFVKWDEVSSFCNDCFSLMCKQLGKMILFYITSIVLRIIDLILENQKEISIHGRINVCLGALCGNRTLRNF